MDNLQNVQPEQKTEYNGELKSRKKAKYLLIFTAISAVISIIFFSILAFQISDIVNDVISPGDLSEQDSDYIANQLGKSFAVLMLIFSLAILGLGITIFVFSIQLIVCSSSEKHEYKTLGLVSGILLIIYVTSLIGLILCIIYVIKTKKIEQK